MRITFVVPLLDVSGGSRIVAGHARRLRAKGHEVLVVSMRQPISLASRVKSAFGAPLPLTPPGESHFGIAEVPFHIARRGGPVTAADVPDADVIIATWWETAEWIWPMPRSKGAKVHFLQHYEAYAHTPKERVDAVWRLPTTKIAVAQWLVDLGREQFGIDNITLAPNSIDHQLFRSRPRAKADTPTVGFLLTHAGFKDLPTTLAALRLVREALPNVRFLAFGSELPLPGELPEGSDFRFTPKQDSIAKIYASCDVWLSTSRTEGFNLPPLEAMGVGTPAVCGKTGRPLEIIEDGVNGFLVDPGDITGFAEAVIKILTLSSSEWERMSKAAVESVAHPTWEESNDAFEGALEHAKAS